VAVLIVGNKSDLKSQREVTWDNATQLCNSIGCELLETSAKTNVNVEKSFTQLATNGVKIVLTQKQNKKDPTGVHLSHSSKNQPQQSKDDESQSGWCCNLI
jgi:GTPase SAR1 family protein